MDSDRLSHIFDSIDGALDDDDLLTSDDAMRWSPAEAAVPDPEATGPRATGGLDSYYQERFERPDGRDTSPALWTLPGQLRVVTGPPGAIRAAGGWCAPSEALYDLPDPWVPRPDPDTDDPPTMSLAAGDLVATDWPPDRDDDDPRETLPWNIHDAVSRQRLTMDLGPGNALAALYTGVGLPGPALRAAQARELATTRGLLLGPGYQHTFTTRPHPPAPNLTPQDLQQFRDIMVRANELAGRFGEALTRAVQEMATSFFDAISRAARELARLGLTPPPTDRAQAVIEARRHRNTGPTTRRRLDGRNQRHHQPPQTHTTHPRRPQHTRRNP